MKCINCQIELKTNTTKPSKFCSDKCRKAFSRQKQGIIENQAENTVLENVPELNISVDNGQVDLNTPQITDKKENGQEITDTPNLHLPDNYGLADCQCQMCNMNRINGCKGIINHGEWKSLGVLAENESNRVALPGDADYKGISLGGLKING
jgi:hypothetical protein